MAAKRWKHQLSRAIPSFQLCRHANHRNSIIAASIYRLSPVNPKSFDITYPSFSGATAVPPSTPEDASFTAPPPPPPRRSASSRTSRLKPHRLSQEGSSSPEFHSKNEKNRREEISTCRDGTAKSSSRKKAWESTDIETLLSPETSRSFSEEWSSTTSTDLFTERSRASTDRKQPPSRVVQNPPAETVAVVKRSENPLEDFKSSMWEVVVEKRLVKPNDLEQLLLSFLSLNSRRYHGVIVEAFSEIWRALFSDHGHLPEL